jgi:hypothetical protein
MNARLFRTAVSVLAGTLLPASIALPSAPPKTSGAITGIVTNAVGTPQMGAVVLLYNRFDRMLQRVLTSENGTFQFGALSPDTYAVRVSLASFLPALRRNIMVQPGMQSLLNVNLASVFSSIELVGVAPGQSSMMSDDWRWVLRSSSASRPVLRLFPELKDSYPRKAAAASMFSDTRGVVKVSAGDQGDSSATGSTDLGTAFAVATSFLGSNRVQLSGNVGYSSVSGAPTAAFGTSFRRELGGGTSSPEVKVTMRQLSLPTRIGASTLGTDAPVLRTLSATMLDSKQLTDSIKFEYGMSMDSVTFLERLNYFSPYGRLTYQRKPGETLKVGYASGTPPPEAFITDGVNDLELQQDLSALALFPRMSLRSATARVQRTQTLEIGYSKKAGSRTYAVAVYNDNVSNGALTMAGADQSLGNEDLLPDLFSNSWTLNVGRYRNAGYLVSVTQALGSRLDVTAAYGSGGALTVSDKAGDAATIDELRSSLRTERRQSLTTRVSGTVPGTGTQFVSSYQWANLTALNPDHMYLTERTREGMGLNIQVRQPLPYFGGLPGHLEATAEMRNLLAQGYVPVMYNGRRNYLMQTARSVRGGVSFRF